MVKAKQMNAHVLVTDSIIAVYKSFAKYICRSDGCQ